MTDLTKGRLDPCNDNLGGVRRFYIMPYVYHSPRQLVGYRTLNLTSFPNTLIYEYVGENMIFTESFNEGQHQQNITLNLVKQEITAAQQMTVLFNNKVRIIVEDNKGLLRVAGLHNGMDVELKSNTGGGKGSFNGYELTFSGIEEFKAPFISGLAAVGFFTEGLAYGCLLSSSGLPSSIADLVSSCNVLQQN